MLGLTEGLTLLNGLTAGEPEAVGPVEGGHESNIVLAPGNSLDNSTHKMANKRWHSPPMAGISKCIVVCNLFLARGMFSKRHAWPTQQQPETRKSGGFP